MLIIDSPDAATPGWRSEAPPVREPLDDVTRERLHSLGYVNLGWAAVPRGPGAAAVRGLGTTLAACLSFAGQYLVSLRADSIGRSLVSGLAFYALALALLFVSLRAGRRGGAAGRGAGPSLMRRPWVRTLRRCRERRKLCVP